MALYSTDKHLNIMFDALAQWKSVEVSGAVPDIQNYDPDFKTFSPDYTLTPLTLKFLCSVSGSGDNTTKNINAQLTNMHFYEIIGGKETEITADNKNYTVTTTGDEAGTIVIKRNGSSNSNTTIRFYAEYVDAVSSRIYRYDISHRLRCMDGNSGTPVLNITAPNGYQWNPLRDNNICVIGAQCLLGKTDVTSKCRIFFYRVLETGQLQSVGTVVGTDWEIQELSAASMTIDLNLIGDEMTYVVKFSYSKDGTPAAAPDDLNGYKTFTIKRVIPKLVVDFKGVPEQVPEGTTYVRPVPFILDSKGLITDYKGILSFAWLTSPKGSDKYTVVATGEQPSIPFSDGMNLQLQVDDKGPLKAVIDSAGKYIVSGGKYLMAR